MQEAASLQTKPEFKFNMFGKDEAGTAGPSSATATAVTATAASQPVPSSSRLNGGGLLDLNLDDQELVRSHS